jgi:hypothetical protein
MRTSKKEMCRTINADERHDQDKTKSENGRKKAQKAQKKTKAELF